MRRLLLLGLALCGMAHAATQPRIDLSATPAWKGWTRPGRVTEIDVRLNADATTGATLDVTAGRQSVHAELELQPGRVMRVQVPIPSAERIAVSTRTVAGAPLARDIGMALSESPLLGVALATDEKLELEGFHTIALAADDLPRNAPAYSSVDALILDAPTLGALDQRQLGALLAHAAGCGRVVVVGTDPRVRRLLDGTAGCGGRALMHAASPAEARRMLDASLAASMPAAIEPADVGGLARPGQLVWNRVAVALAVSFAVAALAVVFFTSMQALLLASALATVAVLALPHAMQLPSQLVVWSEGESGAQVARYQAWQRVTGLVRERARVPIAPQLAAAARPCDSNVAMRLDFDVNRGLATVAEFESRLFRQVSLCFSGSFPMSRAAAAETHPDGAIEVRNTGSMAWPHGMLLAAGLVHDLPALGPGARTIIDARARDRLRDSSVRTALARTRSDGTAALWELDLGGVANVPAESQGWLLVSIAPP